MAPFFTGITRGIGGAGFGNMRGFGGRIFATGGTKISEPDGYTYHYFTTAGPNPFNVSGNPITVDYIIIGSGGAGCGQPGGNNYGGGGGGAGGVRTGSITASVQNYTFNVAGITTALSANYLGVMGSPSSAFGVEAQGGGSGGGYAQPLPETNGGSGGGQSNYTASVGLGNRVTGTTTPAPAQGNDGGGPASAASGGGGGAGSVGGNATPGTGGAGGNGTAFPTWTIPPSYGTPGPSTPLRYFAGGGGGGGNSAGGTSSYGGGGAGSAGTSANSGTINTGGGGGSTGNNGSLDGGSGGSGIIIVRYLT